MSKDVITVNEEALILGYYKSTFDRIPSPIVL